MSGLQKQSNDPRAFSFLNILELIKDTLKPPLMLFVENVVGFEVRLNYVSSSLVVFSFLSFEVNLNFWLQSSDTHSRMIEILVKAGFVTQEFILTPLQFGVPYSRPRYFCLVESLLEVSRHLENMTCFLIICSYFNLFLNLFPFKAKRKPLSFVNQLFDNQLVWSPGPLFGCDDKVMISQRDQTQESLDKLLQSCEPVENFLEFKTPSHQPVSGFIDTNSALIDDFEVTSDRHNIRPMEDYFVPLNLIERWGSAMGILLC